MANPPGLLWPCWAMDIDFKPCIQNRNAETVSLGTQLTVQDMGAGWDCNPSFRPAEYHHRVMLEIFIDINLRYVGDLGCWGI